MRSIEGKMVISEYYLTTCELLTEFSVTLDTE